MSKTTWTQLEDEVHRAGRVLVDAGALIQTAPMHPTVLRPIIESVGFAAKALEIAADYADIYYDQGRE